MNLLGNVLFKECKKTFHRLAMRQVQTPTSALLKPALSTSIQCRKNYTVRGHDLWHSESTLTMGIAVLKPKQTSNAHQTPRHSVVILAAGTMQYPTWCHVYKHSGSLIIWIQGTDCFLIYVYAVQVLLVRLCSLSTRNYTKLIQNELRAESRCTGCTDVIVYSCYLFIYFTTPALTKQIRLIIWLCMDFLCKRMQCDSCYWHPQLLNAAVNRQIRPDALTSRLKVHSNKHNFCIRTNIDLFRCLTGRDTQWSDYNNRWCCNRERKGGGYLERVDVWAISGMPERKCIDQDT